MKYHRLVNKEVVFLLNTIIFFLFSSFLIANIILSQTIPRLYFNVVNEERSAVVTFLQQIMTLPNFRPVRSMSEAVYGSSLRDDIFQEDVKRAALIRELERILTVNPKARDALLTLSRLYEQEGNEKKAQEYLRKAVEIDPQVQSLK